MLRTSIEQAYDGCGTSHPASRFSLLALQQRTSAYEDDDKGKEMESLGRHAWTIQFNKRAWDESMFENTKKGEAWDIGVPYNNSKHLLCSTTISLLSLGVEADHMESK